MGKGACGSVEKSRRRRMKGHQRFDRVAVQKRPKQTIQQIQKMKSHVKECEFQKENGRQNATTWQKIAKLEKKALKKVLTKRVCVVLRHVPSLRCSHHNSRPPSWKDTDWFWGVRNASCFCAGRLDNNGRCRAACPLSGVLRARKLWRGCREGGVVVSTTCNRHG